MAAKRDYLAHLRTVPLFEACSQRELQRVASASDEIIVEAGRVLVNQGQIGHEFFLIMEGKASVRRGTRKIAELSVGDYFGELAVLDQGPRSATVVAETDLQLLVLSQQALYEVLDKVPSLNRKLLAYMARRVRDADSKALGN